MKYSYFFEVKPVNLSSIEVFIINACITTCIEEILHLRVRVRQKDPVILFIPLLLFSVIYFFNIEL